MNNYLKILTIFIMSLIIACSNDNEEDKIILVEEIILNNSNVAINIGEQYQIKTLVSPKNAIDKTLIFEAEDENIAVVNSKGMVNGISEGETDIIITTKDKKVKTKCHFTITKNIVRVESVLLDTKELYLKAGEKRKLTYKIIPQEATVKEVFWTSSNTEVAEISSEGEIVAVSKGECTINITTIEGNKYSECNVIVNEKGDPNICKDNSGRLYKTVQIGNQVWMAENFAYLPVVGELSLGIGYHVYGYNGNNVEEAKLTDNYKKHGVLYSYNAAMASAPDGWHLPTDKDWMELERHIGMTTEQIMETNALHRGDAACKLMAVGEWEGVEATDEYGLGLIPSGSDYKREEFAGMDYGVWLLTSTIIENTINPEDSMLMMRCLKTDYKAIIRYSTSADKALGTVRYVKNLK